MQEEEVRSPDLSDRDIVFDVLFSQRDGLLEGSYHALLEMRFLSVLQTKCACKSSIAHADKRCRNLCRNQVLLGFLKVLLVVCSMAESTIYTQSVLPDHPSSESVLTQVVPILAKTIFKLYSLVT